MRIARMAQALFVNVRCKKLLGMQYRLEERDQEGRLMMFFQSCIKQSSVFFDNKKHLSEYK